MKSATFSFACFLGLATLAHGSVSVQLDCGALKNASGTANEPVGGLLQLIASPSGVFSPVTATSYVSGDNVVVLNLSMNNVFGSGETSNVAAFSLSATGTTVGEDVELRWFPTLTAVAVTPATNPATYVPSSTAPGALTPYGEYRNNVGESNGNGVGIPWTIPADGSTLTTPGGWNFVTMSNGGTTLDLAGDAIFSAAPVPEPSTYALMGCAALGLIGLRLRKNSGAV